MPNYKNAPKEINPHYNREFELLLSGEKKIAVFSTGFFADSDWPDKGYEKVLETTELMTLEVSEIFRYREIKYLYVYYPDQASNIERLRQLFQIDLQPDEEELVDIEVEIGQLLGYSTAQIERWLTFFSIGKPRNRLLYPHRGIELELMLKGEKPLATISDYIDPERGEATGVRWMDEEFSSFVSSGKFLRKESIREVQDESGKIERVHFLYFALPNEAWRIEEMYQLDQRTYSFDDEESKLRDIREGQLLGYTNEEIAAYISHYYGHLE
ncbi:MAG: hypothetical protein R3261_12345 [Alphaproteobacteria bacterium]|nr:hypothetical protein [Alphaproteobacteria bacterium]